MDTPVNLTNLRSMTDGDAEMEKELFHEFRASFEAGIARLREYLLDDNEAWRKQVHALKGIAVNLGADHLGALCKQAQEEYESDAGTKQGLLKNIDAEYSQVKKFLGTL